MGLDFYGANGRICGCASPTGQVWTVSGGYPSDNSGTFVNWGHTNWVQVKQDFIVQSQYPGDGLGAYFGMPHSYDVGEMATPVAIIPFFWCMDSSGEQGVAWFAGAVLYINP